MNQPSKKELQEEQLIHPPDLKDLLEAHQISKEEFKKILLKHWERLEK